MTVTIKPGCGYWDTTQYPLGGCFRRVARDSNGLRVSVLGQVDPPFKGVDTFGTVDSPDGRVSVAFQMRNAD